MRIYGLDFTSVPSPRKPITCAADLRPIRAADDVVSGAGRQIATIFIPLSFITGIYGMNFYIPEVRWPWGYPAILAVMFLISIGMLAYFRKKKWL
jgi:hypothetical protein